MLISAVYNKYKVYGGFHIPTFIHTDIFDFGFIEWNRELINVMLTLSDENYSKLNDSQRKNLTSTIEKLGNEFSDSLNHQKDVLYNNFDSFAKNNNGFSNFQTQINGADSSLNKLFDDLNNVNTTEK